VPLDAIAGIFAKETGYGFAFTLARDPAASLAAAAPPEPDIGAAPERDQPAADDPQSGRKPKSRPSHLQIIK
jgi:stringent starvation protein B